MKAHRGLLGEEAAREMAQRGLQVHERDALVHREAFDLLEHRGVRGVERIAAAKPDVLFSAAYMQDGIALRREMVRQHLPLLANMIIEELAQAIS